MGPFRGRLSLDDRGRVPRACVEYPDAVSVSRWDCRATAREAEDGTRLAFAHGRHGVARETVDLYIANADGSGLPAPDARAGREGEPPPVLVARRPLDRLHEGKQPLDHRRERAQRPATHPVVDGGRRPGLVETSRAQRERVAPQSTYALNQLDALRSGWAEPPRASGSALVLAQASVVCVSTDATRDLAA